MGFFNSLINAILTPVRTIFYWIGRALPGFSRLPRISLPMRVAIMTFILLLILIAAGLIRFSTLDRQTARTSDWIQLHLGYLCGAMVVIPVCSYFLVKLLMEGEKSRFPDIDHAWQAGLDAMAEQGIFLSNTPIFLVVGNSSHEAARNLTQASRIPMNVRGVPDGPGRLHWYANEDAVFLFLTECSCVSKLVFNAEHGVIGGPASGGGPAVPGSAPTGTIVAGSGGYQPPEENTSGTIVAGGDAPAQGLAGPVPSQMPASAAAMGTMQLPGGGDEMPSFGQVPLQQTPPQAAGQASVSTPEANNLTSRLEYVCSLLRKARQPVCPINGVLTLLPFGLIADASSQLQHMLQRDLGTLRSCLKLRCSNTALVTHMDSEEGFQELVRRVGVQRAKDQRFGKGHQVWGDPTDEQLSAIAQHAGGAFEDWTYMLFQEQDGLNKKYNSRLFSLLCKIRGGFTESLESVLVEGFGYNFDRNPELARQQFLFSGCYFAATGATEDRQAFVRSVLQKVSEQENELEWTSAALAEDNRNMFYANLAAAVGALALFALIGMVLIEMEYIPVFWE